MVNTGSNRVPSGASSLVKNTDPTTSPLSSCINSSPLSLGSSSATTLSSPKGEETGTPLPDAYALPTSISTSDGSPSSEATCVASSLGAANVWSISAGVTADRSLVITGEDRNASTLVRMPSLSLGLSLYS